MSFLSITDRSVGLMSTSIGGKEVSAEISCAGRGVDDEHCGDGGKDSGHGALKSIPKFSCQ